MTNTTAEKGAKGTTAATTNEVAFSRTEFSRLFSRVRSECSSVVQDAEKKRPLYSKDTALAEAKRDAVMKALESFIDMVDQAKREA